MLALDVEEPDLAKAEQVAVEPEPAVHAAPVDVVGEVVEVVEAHALGVGLRHPVELGVVGAGVAVAVHEVDERAADAPDGGDVHHAARALVGLGAARDGMAEGVLGIRHAPAHGGRAGAVLGHEAHRVRARLGVDEVGDVALLPDLHGLALVGGDVRVALGAEHGAQGVRVLVGELDELEPVGAGGVGVSDLGMGGVVGEGAHGRSPRC